MAGGADIGIAFVREFNKLTIPFLFIGIQVGKIKDLPARIAEDAVSSICMTTLAVKDLVLGGPAAVIILVPLQ